ncbi:M24 family metallopeptidase [Thermodesulfobacteriota bacterium]
MPTENDYFPVFSDQEYERRYTMIRAAMAEKGLDCLIIYGAYSWGGTDTGQTNAVYLSNYAPVVHSYVVVPLGEEPTLVLSFALHVPNAKDCSVIDDVRAGGFDLIPAVGERLNELGLQKGNLGIVGPLPSWWTSTIPVEHHQYLTQTFPEARFQTVTEWYEHLRIVKSDEEIKLMEKAGVLTDLAHEEIFLATRAGVRHTDLRQIIEGVAGRFGGKYPFSHVGSTSMKNPERYYPDFYPTHRTIEAGDVVMTEVALGYGLYFGKIWGTYFMGEPTEEYRTLFEIAAKVCDRAVAEIKPGMKGSDVAQWVVPIQEAGYVNAVPLVTGWSAYNHAPHAGAIEGSPAANMVKASDLDFEFKPGHTVSIVAFPVTPDMKKGLWIGTTCAFTKDGLKNLHAYPMNTLRVVEV